MVDIGVVELRRYVLKPGRRDDLIALFDREFVETQEALGAAVLGQFRDLDDPDRFVWVRGFADMPARLAALEGFYGGPVWREHRRAANDTMIAWDDVLLLRPVGALRADTATRPSGGAAAAELALTIRFADAPWTGVTADPTDLLTLITEYAQNDFTALPVRTGVHALVRLSPAATSADADADADERMRLRPTGRSWLR